MNRVTMNEWQRYLDEILASIKKMEERFCSHSSRFIVTIPLHEWRNTLQKLYNDNRLKLKKLDVLTVVDQRDQLELVAELSSEISEFRVSIRAQIASLDQEVLSVKSIWPHADWLEQEMWELFRVNIEHVNKEKNYFIGQKKEAVY